MVVQVAQGQVVQVRRETPERWATALQRSIALGVEVFVAADSGERFVTSASQLDTLHRTDGTECTCKAGLSGDPVCCHRAAVRFCLGWLATGDAAPAVAQKCPSCSAGKIVEVGISGPIGCTPCPACGGTGVVPAPPTRPYGLPAGEIVAAAA